MFSQAPCDEILISFVKMPQQIGLDGSRKAIPFHLQEVSRLLLLKTSLPSEGWLCVWNYPIILHPSLCSSPHFKGKHRPVFGCRISPKEWGACQAGEHKSLVPGDPASCCLSWGWGGRWGMVLPKMSDEGGRRLAQHPVKIGLVLPAEDPEAACLQLPFFHPSQNRYGRARPPITSQEFSSGCPLLARKHHILKSFPLLPLSRNPIVRMLPVLLIWVWICWNRLISWGSIQEMFILYFKISLKKKL